MYQSKARMQLPVSEYHLHPISHCFSVRLSNRQIIAFDKGSLGVPLGKALVLRKLCEYLTLY